MKNVILCFLLLIFYHLVQATITLPAVLGDDMVLQQKSTVKIWGWGNPLEKLTVTCSWNHGVDSAIVQPDATWQVSVKTIEAGGPYTIQIKGTNTIVLSNVMLGEVWICSGQSNMEMSYGWGLPDVKAALPNCANNQIRFFTVDKASSEHPQLDCKGHWASCDSNSLKAFSAAAYFFAKKINGTLNIPVGMIGTYWGATPAEVWTPSDLMKIMVF